MKQDIKSTKQDVCNKMKITNLLIFKILDKQTITI